MRPSVAAGMILSDFGKVVFVEDATIYTHTGDILYTTKKTWVGGIVVPSGECWALEGVLFSAELKTSIVGFPAYAQVLANSILVTTPIENDQVAYSLKEEIDFPPANPLLLKEGSYDIELQLKIADAAKTNSTKNTEIRLCFRRYAT